MLYLQGGPSLTAAAGDKCIVLQCHVWLTTDLTFNEGL